ncbi:hypothetical protein [Natrinema caseinilyticum]|nr:hypothetical protein [Natrinema caseinilyticum]
MALESHGVRVFSRTSRRDTGHERSACAGVGDQPRRLRTGFGFFFAR